MHISNSSERLSSRRLNGRSPAIGGGGSLGPLCEFNVPIHHNDGTNRVRVLLGIVDFQALVGRELESER